ncbi:F0F1 ATP synthase subunit A [Oscillospiraceae bacterium MB08-C2-2]|nr:F0F1 ATP synthase subunit A [Oscillospiraceae bacterium MB08-C2-2]
MADLDFSDKNLAFLFRWGDVDIYLTDTLLSTWIVMGALVIFAIVVRIRLTRFKSVPKGFQNAVEIMVETMANFSRNTMGPGMDALGGYFFGVFAFILISNFSGLVGLRPPTADLATTGALALSSFVLIHGAGLAKRKWKYFKDYLAPVPIFLPLNLVGEIAKPVSLGFRLFGNILGGTIIMGLVYNSLPILLRFILPDLLHAYFDLFAGAIQAFIFTVLSMTFIQQKAAGE